MFLILFRNILCPQQMFPSLRSPRNIMGNNVSSFTRALIVYFFVTREITVLCYRFRQSFSVRDQLLPQVYPGEEERSFDS